MKIIIFIAFINLLAYHFLLFRLQFKSKNLNIISLLNNLLFLLNMIGINFLFF